MRFIKVLSLFWLQNRLSRCQSCVRNSIKDIEPFIRLFLTIFVATTCCALYYRSSRTVLASKQIDRKTLLTAVFAAIMILWMILVFPHVFYVTFIAKHEFEPFFIGLAFYGASKQMQHFANSAYFLVGPGADYAANIQSSFENEAKHIIVDLVLRVLRMSFGILNTVLVLILLKPFHEPILKFLHKMRKTLKNIYCFFVKIFANAETTRKTADTAEN